MSEKCQKQTIAKPEPAFFGVSVEAYGRHLVKAAASTMHVTIIELVLTYRSPKTPPTGIARIVTHKTTLTKEAAALAAYPSRLASLVRS
jgi:hypothetical protein